MRRSPLYICARRGSSVPLPARPDAIGAALSEAPAAAAPVPAAASLSPGSGLMNSLSSWAPSRKVNRTRRSTKANMCTAAAPAISSLSLVATALYSGIAKSRFSQAK